MVNKVLLIGGIVVGILVIFTVVALALGLGQDTFLTVHYYDGNRNEISAGWLSVVGGVEGVEFISLDVNVDNTGEVPLELSIKSASPPRLSSALPTNTINLGLGEQGSWASGLFDITSYEGTTQIFEVTVEGEYSFAGKVETLEKTGVISLSIQPNPVAGFDVDVVFDGSGDDDIEVPCTENWVCGEWGVCTNSEQIRPCDDLNNCGTTNDMPDIVRSCSDNTVVFRTYDLDFIREWIMYLGVGYGYVGYDYSTTSSIYPCSTNPFPGVLDLNVLKEGRWLVKTDAENIYICRDYLTNGQYVKHYATTDPDALNAVLTTDPTEPWTSDGLEITQ